MSKHKGFTLIEIIVALGIVTIISSLVLSILGTGGVSWSLVSAKVFLRTQARQAVLNISRELMESTRSRTFIGAGGTSIRFSIPLVDETGAVRTSPGGDLLWGDGETEGNFINYTLSNGNLVRQILNASLNPVGQERIIAQYANAFQVQLLTSQFEFTLTLSVDRYSGRLFSPPINYSISFAVIPKN